MTLEISGFIEKNPKNIISTSLQKKYIHILNTWFENNYYSWNWPHRSELDSSDYQIIVDYWFHHLNIISIKYWWYIYSIPYRSDEKWVIWKNQNLRWITNDDQEYRDQMIISEEKWIMKFIINFFFFPPQIFL